MRVLGIDPSSQATGFGVLEDKEGGYAVLGFGVIRPKPYLSLPEKLNEIRGQIDLLLSRYCPEEAAIENPFYARNIRTAITLGQVRGAVLVAVAAHGCRLYEYSPREIKKAVTGYGQAEKNQVMTMVKALLHLQDINLEPDASDALATAFCHLNHRQTHVNLSEAKTSR